jgi:hypothetical protein
LPADNLRVPDRSRPMKPAGRDISVRGGDRRWPPVPPRAATPPSAKSYFLSVLACLAFVSGCDHELTTAEGQNAYKIACGMTEAEVRHLFTSTPKESTNPGGYKVLTWGSDSDSISVMFADGRVSTVKQTQRSGDTNLGSLIGLASVVIVVIVGATILIVLRPRRSRQMPNGN